MKRSTPKHEYVVLPESIATALETAQSSAELGFTISAGGHDALMETLPGEESLEAIRVESLSRSDIKKVKERGDVERTVYPLVTYLPQIAGIGELAARPSATKPGAPSAPPATNTHAWRVQVVDSKAQMPIQGVRLVAFCSANRTNGVEGHTDTKGEVALQLPGTHVSELFVLPAHTHWSKKESDVGAKAATHVVQLAPLDAAVPSAAQLAKGAAVAGGTGKNVRVGVIDTGVGPHPDVTPTAGTAPLGDASGDFADSGCHGTHVAGIIAGKGPFPGLAPDCEIRSYRVFRKGVPGARNSDIVAAVFQAMNDGCHIINMSLGSSRTDPLTAKALTLAMSRGVLVVASSGNGSTNGNRARVLSPARVAGVVSVSAVGCKNSYPPDSVHVNAECAPPGSTASHYIANFANAGAVLRCTAPGVAVISTVPGGYTAMDGTSMSAPAVTGIAACLLSANPAILAMPTDARRTDAMRQLLYGSCNTLGFSPMLEGKYGFPS